MDNIRKGWILALITSVLWAMYAIFLKTASTYMDNVNGLVVVLQAMVAGSFLLLLFSGSGRLSIETLKNSYTWSFGTLQLLSNIFTFAALTYALSATSLTLLTRFSIILSVLVTYLFDQKAYTPSKLGFSLVLIGSVVVASSINEEFRNISLFWVFLVCAVKVKRSRIASKHRENISATGDFRSELRVTGYILAVTSCFYALLLFITMNLEFDYNLPNIIPSKLEFFALEPLLLSMGIGAVIMACMRYTELVSTKHIGGTNFLTVMAFTPLFTYISQYVLSLFDIIPAPITNIYEITGGLLIILGAVLLARQAVNGKGKTIKLAPKAKQELLVLRDTISTTMIFFNDNEDLVAKKLGVGKRTIKSIMTTDKKVSKNVKNTIIFNHAQNVAGFDHLTGLYNKASFESKLKLLNEVENALILFIDLDRFKPVNDTYGHKAGDSILEGVAERLLEEFPTPNIVSRIGGDEFCIIAYNIHNKESNKIVKKIKDIVSQPFIIENVDKEVSVGCSVGYAHYPIDSNISLELSKIADKRMYKNKYKR